MRGVRSGMTSLRSDLGDPRNLVGGSPSEGRKCRLTSVRYNGAGLVPCCNGHRHSVTSR